MGNAQALRGEEGRDKLRKAAGNGTYIVIRRYPNGATHYIEDIVSARKQTRGTETSKYPEEKKTKVIPLVVASERGLAQTKVVTAILGLQDYDIQFKEKQNCLERQTIDSDSLVYVSDDKIAVS